MTNDELGGFIHRYETGSGDRTLLVLHGTGADENDLIPLGRALAPDANILSPRGQVLENGMPRFFRRFAEGVLDVDDLKARTDGLVGFLDAAAEKYGLDKGGTIAVGFSNGANIAGSVLLRHPTALRAAVLYRPMLPYEPDGLPDLSRVRVFMGAGRADPLIEARDTERLAEILREAGADVTLEWVAGGHQLQSSEVEAARRWLAEA